MKFVCERCHTKYSIADEKVRGKVLKVRCKTCANVITVRETGAAIDDLPTGAPREQPVSRSGSFDAAGDGDTVVAPRGAALGKLANLPVGALFEPSAPIAAPPPASRSRTRDKGAGAPPAPPTHGDDIDWYLAVDGAQTGPFSRARLLDKILATDTGADVHVWNADFDGWKAPAEVADLHAELSRRRRSLTPVPPPPVRRRSASAGMPSLAAAASVGAVAGASIAEAGLATVESHSGPVAHKISAPGHKKKNGVAAAAAVVGSAVGSVTGKVFGDLLGTEASSAINATGLNLHARSGSSVAADGPSISSLPSGAVVSPLAGRPSRPVDIVPAAPGKNRQLKLMLGALGVAVVLCGIVAVWLFRHPTQPVAASREPASSAPKPAPATDFASLAEQLKKEEAQGQADKGQDKVVTPEEAAPVEPKVAVARLEPSPRSTKGKQARRKNQGQIAPPRFSQAPVGGGLTAEQRDAANRFGDSTGRDVRMPSLGGGSSRTTPAQGDISRVINNNRQGIQTCYQRALLRDNTLTHGKVTVRVSIGLSGKVKSVNLDAPAQFRALEPCIRDVMSRWAFPPSSEEYGTEFPVVLQGNQ